MKRLLREPLIHFLLIGAALFAVYHFVSSSERPDPSASEIRVTPEELDRLTASFRSERHRDPTQAEFDLLLEDLVRTEILYREAVAMGLDEDDDITKRRMAQRVHLLAEDAAITAREPSEAELRRWFEANKATFAQPPTLSFRHLYFASDRRGARARDDAAAALEQLAGQPEDSELGASLADPFAFRERYRDRQPDSLVQDFGPRFAEEIQRLPIGSWQGPVESDFGWHVVFVDAVTPSRVPEFEDVEVEVRLAWLDERKAQAWEDAYEEIRAKYTVLLPASTEANE